jgi:hypothetical protein
LYAGALLALLLVVALLVAHPWTDDSAATDDGSDPSTPAKAEDDTVNVSRSTYVGQPVDDVVDALRGKGLKTTVRTQDNPGGKDRDTVASLSPTGDVKKGSTITVRAWGDPPAEPQEPAATQTEPADPETSAEPDKGKGNNSGPGKSEDTKVPKPEKSEKPGNTNERAPALDEPSPTQKGN